MSGKSNDQGRAFEYICLRSLQDAISAIRPSKIIRNSSYDAAECAWHTLTDLEKKLFSLSAKSTIATIFAMEPNLIEVDNDTLHLYLQPDRQGESADVRDIIIERNKISWAIGLSIKHNHLAVKHSRLAKELDFGDRWYGIKCSADYWENVKPIFNLLEVGMREGKYFRELKNKYDEVYIPLLRAFMNEVRKQVEKDTSIPRRLVEYLLSRYDFYKIISHDSKRLTTIQSFNMYGTLNRPSRQTTPTIRVPKIKLPTTLVYIGFKPKSKTTVIMCFDNGWQFSFRIHNAKDTIEPSLKFDIRIVGIPADVNIRYNCNW